MRLGCDPEVFLMEQNRLKPVFGLVKADKWNPLQVEGLDKGFTWQEDNVALEFGIPPADTREKFVEYVKKVQQSFLNKHSHLTFCKLSCVIFPKELLDGEPQAFMFGCEPDFNAWTEKENPKPKPASKYMRAAGGHIHVETDLDKNKVVQAMDFFLGIPSLLMDENPLRRKMYGKAGAHRPKSYGVEYRTLSNFWIFEDKYIKWVWDNTQRALDAVASRKDYSCSGEHIQRVINSNNKDDAEIIVHAFDLEVV